MLDLDEPIVICIPDEARHPVARNLILEINIRDWWPIVVRMEALVRDDVPESDFHSPSDILKGLICPFGFGVSSFLSCDYAPVVVRIAVGIQRNLLF